MTAERYSLDAYRKVILALAESNREFGPFTAPPQPGVLLRHDVDYCLPTAARIAEVNRDAGVRATFFVLVSSPLYTIFAKAERNALRTIVEAGQFVGLHYHHTGGELNHKRLNREFDALRLIVPEAQRVVAWHNPEGELAPLNKKADQLDFISAYAPPFFGDSVYVSDSNCRNTPEQIAAFGRKDGKGCTQILLHPLIWVHGGNDMQTVLARTFRARLETTADTYGENSLWQKGAGRAILSRFNLDVSHG